LDEELPGLAQLGLRSGKGANRIDQLGSGIGRTALITIVAILVLRTADGTGPLHEAVGKECLYFRIVKLLDFTLDDQILTPHCRPDFVAILAGLFAVRAPVMVELDLKTGKIALVRCLHVGDKFFLAASLLTG